MANRRMFSKEIIGSDLFLDLPVSSRELYFQLGMYADDDGFVAPKKIIRMIGASDDDIKVLTVKGLVIPFESGVIVIRHWKENNYIQSDRYTPTLYKDEFKTLECLNNVYILDTQVRLGKVKTLTDDASFKKNDDFVDIDWKIPFNRENHTFKNLKVVISRDRRQWVIPPKGKYILLNEYKKQCQKT